MNNNMNNNNNNVISMVIAKDTIELLTNDVYSNKEYIKEDIFKELDKFKVFVSLQLSGLVIEDTNSFKNLICSSMICFRPDFNAEKIVNKLQYTDYSNDLHIVNVSWLQSINLNVPDEISVNSYKFLNSLNSEYTLNFYNMSYQKFFNNLGQLFEFRSDIEKKDKN